MTDFPKLSAEDLARKMRSRENQLDAIIESFRLTPVIDFPKLSDEDLARKITNLQVKVDTTPRLMGRFMYESMLRKATSELDRRTLGHLRLKLCFNHRQEQNMSHYSPKNCDHCKLIEQLKLPGE